MSNLFGLCFDLSGFQGLPFSLAQTYRTNWNTYNRIQIVNSNISVARNRGDVGLVYYQYVTYEEREQFISGQMLHIRRYPQFSWLPVPQD